MVNEKHTIQVSGVRESEKSIGALVDLKFNEKGDVIAGMTLVWFPKSLCYLSEIEIKNGLHSKAYFISAPKWFLEKNNIKITLK